MAILRCAIFIFAILSLYIVVISGYILYVYDLCLLSREETTKKKTVEEKSPYTIVVPFCVFVCVCKCNYWNQTKIKIDCWNQYTVRSECMSRILTMQCIIQRKVRLKTRSAVYWFLCSERKTEWRGEKTAWLRFACGTETNHTHTRNRSRHTQDQTITKQILINCGGIMQSRISKFIQHNPKTRIRF